jgi:hypothetical protein
MRTPLRISFPEFFFVALKPVWAKAVWKCSYYPTFRRLFWIWGSHSRGYEDYCLLECDAYSSVEVHLSFGGTYWFYLQGRRVTQASNQEEAVVSRVTYWLLFWVIRPCGWRQYVSPKRWTSTWLLCVISQKMVLFVSKNVSVSIIRGWSVSVRTVTSSVTSTPWWWGRRQSPKRWILTLFSYRGSTREDVFAASCRENFKSYVTPFFFPQFRHDYSILQLLYTIFSFNLRIFEFDAFKVVNYLYVLHFIGCIYMWMPSVKSWKVRF